MRPGTHLRRGAAALLNLKLQLRLNPNAAGAGIKIRNKIKNKSAGFASNLSDNNSVFRGRRVRVSVLSVVTSIYLLHAPPVFPSKKLIMAAVKANVEEVDTRNHSPRKRAQRRENSSSVRAKMGRWKIVSGGMRRLPVGNGERSEGSAAEHAWISYFARGIAIA